MTTLPPNFRCCICAIVDDIGSQHAASPDSRTVDLSGVQVTVSSATILSDIFTIEWGLRKLILKECNLDEHVSIRSLRRCASDLLGRISNLSYTHC